MSKPVVMFACIHNSGRSVAAKVLAEHYGRGRIEVRSAGSEPGEGVNPQIEAVLGERGLSASGHQPSMLTHESVESSDVVITMGCGETCPVFPGKRYEDWQLDDPKGQNIEAVRKIVDEIDGRVRRLIQELAGEVTGIEPGAHSR